MATGDSNDMASRMAAVLPARWFPPLAEAPILGGLLTGIGAGWSYCWTLLAYAAQQARIATASGAFLDMISADFNGTGLPRAPGESDDGFRARISANLLSERATRSAVTEAVTALTGGTVSIVEPMRPADTGAYAASAEPSMGGGGGYGSAILRYGSLALPYTFFIDASGPTAAGFVLSVAGYASVGSIATTGGIGGYGEGELEYAPSTVLDDVVTDATVEAAIVASLPVGCTAWVRFS